MGKDVGDGTGYHGGAGWRNSLGLPSQPQRWEGGAGWATPGSGHRRTAAGRPVRHGQVFRRPEALELDFLAALSPHRPFLQQLVLVVVSSFLKEAPAPGQA